MQIAKKYLVPTQLKENGVMPREAKFSDSVLRHIIRLDGHLGDRQDIALTRNPYGIAVEFNASQMLSLDLLIERGAYPQKVSM